jgi:opacity protein-like surface antigen
MARCPHGALGGTVAQRVSRGMRHLQRGIQMQLMQRVGAMVLGMVIASTLQAQAQSAAAKPTSFGVHAGIGLPLGDFGDAVGTGFGVHGTIWYQAANPKLRFRGDVGFDRYSGENSISVGNVSVSSSSTIIPIMGSAIWALGDPKAATTSKPYIIGGAGLIGGRGTAESRVGNVTTSRSETDFNLGIQIGAGVEFKLSGFSTFAEAKIVNAFGDGGSARYIPLMFGIKF